MPIYYLLLLLLFRFKLTQSDEHTPICTSEILNEIVKCMNEGKVNIENLFHKYMIHGDIPQGALYWRQYDNHYVECGSKNRDVINNGCCSSPKNDDSKTCAEIDRLSKIWVYNLNKIASFFRYFDEHKMFWDIVHRRREPSTK